MKVALSRCAHLQAQLGERKQESRQHKQKVVEALRTQEDTESEDEVVVLRRRLEQVEVERLSEREEHEKELRERKEVLRVTVKRLELVQRDGDDAFEELKGERKAKESEEHEKALKEAEAEAQRLWEGVEKA